MISITPKNGYNLADYPSGGSRMLGGCDLPDYRISMQNTQVLVVLRSGEHISDLGVHIHILQRIDKAGRCVGSVGGRSGNE